MGKALRSFIAAGALAAFCAIPSWAQGGSEPGETVRDCDVCPQMVTVPGGTFIMGSPAAEPGRNQDEGPQHPVTLAPFLLGRTEVTVRQFRTFVDATGYRTDAERNEGRGGCYAWGPLDGSAGWRDGVTWRRPGWQVRDDQPVVCMSWNDAQAYVAWLRRMSGKDYRLPSEAQWEYAARAGTHTTWYWGEDPGAACVHANVADLSESPDGRFHESRPHPCQDNSWFVAVVASYRANAFGLYDMLGNAWEWTADCYHPTYSGAPQDGRPWVEANCAWRVGRGGGWFSYPGRVRSANRGEDYPWYRNDGMGIRVARPVDR